MLMMTLLLGILDLLCPRSLPRGALSLHGRGASRSLFSLVLSSLVPGVLPTLASVVLSVGCAGAASQAHPSQAQPSQVVAGGPSVTVPTSYVTAVDAGMLSDRMREATAWFDKGLYERAAHGFDRVFGFEPGGVHAPMALYGAGLSYEALGRFADAASRYRQLVDGFPDHDLVGQVLLRGSRLLSMVEDWEGLARFGELLVARSDVALMDKIEGYGAHALGLVATGDLDRSMRSIGKARGLMEQHGLLDGGRLTVGMAQVFFAYGEVLRLQGEQIVFEPLPPDFSQALERRCQLLLDAQEAYGTVTRAYDSRWSAMAGYRIGSMYQTLHADLMRIQPPTSARTVGQRQLFFGAMELRYRVLLRKGLSAMDRTLAMAERTGEVSLWVQRARESKLQLERRLELVNEAIAELPYSEDELQRALDGIAGAVDKP